MPAPIPRRATGVRQTDGSYLVFFTEEEDAIVRALRDPAYRAPYVPHVVAGVEPIED